MVYRFPVAATCISECWSIPCSRNRASALFPSSFRLYFLFTAKIDLSRQFQLKNISHTHNVQIIRLPLHIFMHCRAISYSINQQNYIMIRIPRNFRVCSFFYRPTP